MNHGLKRLDSLFGGSSLLIEPLCGKIRSYPLITAKNLFSDIKQIQKNSLGSFFNSCKSVKWRIIMNFLAKLLDELHYTLF